MFKIILADRDLQFDTPLTVPGVEFCFCIEADQLKPENHSRIRTGAERERPIWLSATVKEMNDETLFHDIARLGFSGLLLRECTGPQDVEKAATLLTVAELESGSSPGQTAIIAAFADTAMAALRLNTWSFAPERLAGYLLDLQRLAHSLGHADVRDRSGALVPPLSTVRDHAILAAAALGMPLYAALSHTEADEITAALQEQMQWGCAGCCLSHPAQTAVILQALQLRNDLIS